VKRGHVLPAEVPECSWPPHRGLFHFLFREDAVAKPRQSRWWIEVDLHGARKGTRNIDGYSPNTFSTWPIFY
jgi:hypothetical protein